MKKSDNSCVNIIDINLFSERCTVPVHKLLYIVFLLCFLIVFTGCEFFNRPMLDFLEEWTNTAQIGKHSLDGSYPETGGMVNLPSGSDRVITYYVANPQSYDLGIEVTFDPNLPGWDPIRTSNHPDFSTTSNQGTVEQDPIDKSIIRLTLNENALASLDGTGSTLNPTISIVEPNSGRTFGSYTIPIRVNSAPNKAKNAVIMTWYDGTVYKYAVLFHLPQDLNNPDSPDRDVVSMSVSGFNGQYNKTFAIPASGDIGGVENTYAQGDFSPVDSGDSFVPFSGYRFVGIKTDFIVGDVVPSCTVTLGDSSGLESTTDVSTTTTKLTEIYVDPASGNDSYPGSDLLPVATVGKAMEKLSGMTNTTIILVGDINVQNTLAFTASYPNITLKGGVTPVTLTYSGTGRAITVSGGKLTLGENITITGADDGAVELTGGEFVMETGSTLSGNGVFPGTTIPPVYIDGGAVCVRGGTFTMKGGTINSNEASSGGAVYVDDGSFTMSGGTISNNDAASGGGVSVRAGSFTMSGTDAKIQGNEASQAGGGGVQVGGGTFTITDGTISGNTAWKNAGGGIYVNGGNVSVSGGSIDNNNAETVGGGVYVSSGSMEISGSVTIKDNKHIGIEIDPEGIELYAYAGNLTISGGNILGQDYKKEIYSANTFTITGSPTIDKCTITLEQGAHIDVQGLSTDAALTNLQISPTAYTAGEVLLEHATDMAICKKFGLDSPPTDGIWWIGPEKGNGVLKTIEGTYNKSTNTITVPTMPGTKDELQNTVNGSAESGVKVEITGGRTITVDSAVSVPDGADVAIKPDSGSVNINAPGDTTAFNVSGGELTLGGGGGTVTVDGGESSTRNGSKSLITVGTGGTLNITTGATIQNNKMSSGNGGGIAVSGGGTVNMDGGSIVGCESNTRAGGIYITGTGSSFVMSSGSISSCYQHSSSSGDGGGAVGVYDGGSFTLKGDAQIFGNQARRGGGVMVWSASFTMDGGVIGGSSEAEGNIAWGSNPDFGGGAVYVRHNSTFLLKRGTISQNKTTRGDTPGGGIRVISGTFRYITCTFSGNTAVNGRGPDVFINAGVLYATTENGDPKALTTEITKVDGLSSPTYN